MKTKPIAFTRGPFWARGFRSRTVALVASLAMSVCTAVRLDAVVIDDFENPTRSATLWQGWPWNGTGTNTFSDGHVTLEVTPPPNEGAFYNFLLSDRTWKIQEGRTLEFRVDLLGCNADGAVAWFGFYLNDGDRGYHILVDPDTIALHKKNSPGEFFFVNNGPVVDVSNVKLVVSMTGVTNSVRLKFRILNNETGGVILDREYWDTPAADPMQVGTDNPPGSYLGQTGYFLMCLLRDPQYLDPDVPLPPGTKAEVTYDNAEVIEYHPPHLEIAPATNGVALNWLLPKEEHIVVEADPLAGPWRPCPQPHARIGDTFCLNMSCQSRQKFFKLTPGIQFFDDFSGAKLPWVPYFYGDYSWRYEFAVTNGTYRIKASSSSSDSRVAILPPGPDVVVRDFTASVDLLDWTTNANVLIGIGARVWRDPGPPFPGNSYGYIGKLYLNDAGQLGRGRVGIFPDPSPGPSFPLDPTLDYRLEFSGLGTGLSIKLFKLNDLSTPVSQFSITNSTYRSEGLVALWLESPGPSTTTLDNFIVTGTK